MEGVEDCGIGVEAAGVLKRSMMLLRFVCGGGAADVEIISSLSRMPDMSDRLELPFAGAGVGSVISPPISSISESSTDCCLAARLPTALGFWT